MILKRKVILLIKMGKASLLLKDLFEILFGKNMQIKQQIK
jgi:hypothetical protein